MKGSFPQYETSYFHTDGADYTLADGTEGSLRGYDNVVLLWVPEQTMHLRLHYRFKGTI